MLQLGRAPCKRSCRRANNEGDAEVRGWVGGGGGHSLGLGFGVRDLADEDAVLRVADLALLVHVGGGDGEQRAVAVERQRGDAGRVAVELAQALLVERVPDVDEAVRATWEKERPKVKL